MDGRGLEPGECQIDVEAAIFGRALFRKIDQLRKDRDSLTPQPLGTLLCGLVTGVCGDLGFDVGERVVLNPHHPCGDCEKCSVNESGCDNYVSIYPCACSSRAIVSDAGSGAIVPVSLNIDPKIMVQAELVGCILHAVNTGRVSEGDRVCVLGRGGLSHLSVATLEAVGLVRCVHLSYKEAENVVRGEAGQKFDVVLDLSVNERSLSLAPGLLNPFGRWVLFSSIVGANLGAFDYNWVHYNQCQVLGSYHCTKDDFLRAVRLIEGNSVVFERVPRSDIVFADLTEGSKLDALTRGSIVTLIPN